MKSVTMTEVTRNGMVWYMVYGIWYGMSGIKIENITNFCARTIMLHSRRSIDQLFGLFSDRGGEREEG